MLGLCHTVTLSLYLSPSLSSVSVSLQLDDAAWLDDEHSEFLEELKMEMLEEQRREEEEIERAAREEEEQVGGGKQKSSES